VNWPSWAAFWSMGGYGLYVWGSYAVVTACIAIEVVLLRRQRRAATMQAGVVSHGRGEE
jgi:heme exporter protein D